MDHVIATVREFNRFYTRLVGALDPRFLGSPLPLAEARILFEIARDERPLAADLQAALDLDAGYVSRVLRKFETDGLIVRERGEGDARKRPIVLTAAGRAAFEAIDARQREKVEAMLRPLGSIERRDLLAALTTTRALLGSPPPGYAIRTFRTGDMGLVAARQSIVYAEAFGWGRPLEIIVCEVTAAFLRGFKPGRDQCWIAEVDGVMSGSIFVTDDGDGSARLRLLYVEPFARGLGIGSALVRSCVDFAREVGYRSLTLWTHTILVSARRIYAAHGFRLVETKMHEEFGTSVQGETWRLDFGDTSVAG
jgi:DNA-binding MarR family transcriptional regulator/GNAT superfamily N-acetyltransferase